MANIIIDIIASLNIKTEYFIMDFRIKLTQTQTDVVGRISSYLQDHQASLNVIKYLQV